MSDLSELFSRDPLQLTKSDRAEIIAHMRENRAKFMLGQKTAKISPKEKKAVPKGGLSLDDLGI